MGVRVSVLASGMVCVVNMSTALQNTRYCHFTSNSSPSFPVSNTTRVAFVSFSLSSKLCCSFLLFLSNGGAELMKKMNSCVAMNTYQFGCCF